MRDASAFAYSASLGRNSKLSETNEGEASGDGSDLPKQVDTNGSSTVTPSILR